MEARIDVISPVQNIYCKLIGLAFTPSGLSVACTEVSRKSILVTWKGDFSAILCVFSQGHRLSVLRGLPLLPVQLFHLDTHAYVQVCTPHGLSLQGASMVPKWSGCPQNQALCWVWFISPDTIAIFSCSLVLFWGHSIHQANICICGPPWRLQSQPLFLHRRAS